MTAIDLLVAVDIYSVNCGSRLKMNQLHRQSMHFRILVVFNLHCLYWACIVPVSLVNVQFSVIAVCARTTHNTKISHYICTHNSQDCSQHAKKQKQIGKEQNKS